MSARYAERTEVPSDRSRAEIEKTLQRYGATAFGYGWGARGAEVIFEVADRRIRLVIPLPRRDDERLTVTPSGRQRSASAASDEYERAVRQSWRALSLVIKAKLEAVAAGITTVEAEFLAHIVLPSGGTVGDWAQPQIARAYEQNTMPELMPGGAR